MDCRFRNFLENARSPYLLNHRSRLQVSMDRLAAIFVVLILMMGVQRTERPLMLIWPLITPLFFLIFGAKSMYVSFGFTEIEVFSGILPVVVCIVAYRRLTPTEKKRAWKYSPKL